MEAGGSSSLGQLMTRLRRQGEAYLMPANVGRPRAKRGNADGVLGDGVIGGVHPGGRFRRQAGEYGKKRDGNLHGYETVVQRSPCP